MSAVWQIKEGLGGLLLSKSVPVLKHMGLLRIHLRQSVKTRRASQTLCTLRWKSCWLRLQVHGRILRARIAIYRQVWPSEPELIELPMAAGADSFWSGVKITTDGLWHLPISWWLVPRQLVSSILFSQTLVFAFWLAHNKLPSSKLSQCSDCFALSCVDRFNHWPHAILYTLSIDH